MNNFKILPKDPTMKMIGEATELTGYSIGLVTQIYQLMYDASPIEQEVGPIGEGTPHARFDLLVNALERRFPHPNPFDSSRGSEDYALDSIDILIERSKPYPGFD